jgi:hypothetical protein
VAGDTFNATAASVRAEAAVAGLRREREKNMAGHANLTKLDIREVLGYTISNRLYIYLPIPSFRARETKE